MVLTVGIGATHSQLITCKQPLLTVYLLVFTRLLRVHVCSSQPACQVGKTASLQEAALLHCVPHNVVWPDLLVQTNNERGIVISAGGSYYLPQAIVLLRVLRHHLKSKLPVEIFWMGAEEMDEATLKVC